jgi:hypothetical protein
MYLFHQSYIMNNSYGSRKVVSFYLLESVRFFSLSLISLFLFLLFFSSFQNSSQCEMEFNILVHFSSAVLFWELQNSPDEQIRNCIYNSTTSWRVHVWINVFQFLEIKFLKVFNLIILQHLLLQSFSKSEFLFWQVVLNTWFYFKIISNMIWFRNLRRQAQNYLDFYLKDFSIFTADTPLNLKYWCQLQVKNYIQLDKC